MTKQELREQIAESLGLEKGGITKHDSPANEHYYFVNVVEDPETEQVIVEQHISFEEELDNLMTLFDQALIEARVDELNRLQKLHTRTYRQTVTDNTGEVYVNDSHAFISKYETQERVLELKAQLTKPERSVV